MNAEFGENEMSRYIDAEKIKFEPIDIIVKGITHRTIERMATKTEIDAMPTIDVEEVRHGEWEVRHRHEHYPSGKPYEENICPFCKRADHNGDGLYCGYCGAKMDGGKE